MTKRTTKKALVLSLLSLLLCCSMLVGTTFAWFTDSVTSGKNKIVAGNLDVGLEYLAGGKWEAVDENTNVFEEDTLWEPGHTEVVYLKISNLGTLALDYHLGINIASETESVNVFDEPLKLSDHIQMAAIKGVTTAYASREAARAAVTSSKAINEGYAQEGTLHPANNLPTDGVKEEYVALVVYMPETVENEANYKTGAAVPEILLGINLLATQETYEKDSFDENYDASATLPAVGTGSAPVKPNSAFTYIEARIQNDGSTPKMASFTIPNAALADGAENVTVKVVKTGLNQEIVITDDQEAVTYDVTVTGLKENNTTPVVVELSIGTGKSGIKLYHYDEEINYISYNETTGILTFETAEFSPFSVVYDAVYVPTVPTDPDLPQATVEEVQLTEPIEWKQAPADSEQQLEVVYKYAVQQNTEEMQASKYRNWNCDFYVSCDADVATGDLVLGGHYGSYGWVGFENPIDVTANTETPLLGSVAQVPWTYEQIHGLVGEFMCGVSRTAQSMDKLEGATFTVKLRLTNPENLAEYYDVSVIPYTFPTVVTSGEELQDAINNGSTNIQLGNDIDLNDGPIVIPGN